MDWLTASKPRHQGKLEELVAVVSAKLSSSGISTSFGNGAGRYGEGVDVACHGRLCWRPGVDPVTEKSCGYDLVLDLSGQAMDYLRQTGLGEQELAAWLSGLGFTATRVDTALDTDAADINVGDIYRQYFQSQEKRSALLLGSRNSFIDRVLPDGRVKGCASFNENSVGGESAYLPGPNAPRRLNIYGKLSEYVSKWGRVPVDENGVPFEHLTRFELRHRDEHAQFVFSRLVSEGVSCLPSVFVSFIEFLDPRSAKKHGEHHKERATRVAWWRRLVGVDAKRLRAGLHRVSTPERAVRHVKRSVGPMLATLRAAGMGRSVDVALSSALPNARKVRTYENILRSQAASRAGVFDFVPMAIRCVSRL